MSNLLKKKYFYYMINFRNLKLFKIIYINEK